MISRLKQWVEERWPLTPVIRLAVDEEIPGGARFAYSLGSAVLIVFSLQAISGIMQLFFYVPTTDHAYDSISYLRTKVPFGWLIHGLHYWGAQLMVILVLLHMSRVFLWGAYKKPRELTWLAGFALFLITMAFTFTGSPLHWDQSGYWVGEVSTGVSSTVPVVGGISKIFMRGGEEMGQLALSRMFGLHVLVLPLALVALFSVHIIAMRRFGSVGPWEEQKREPKGPFWPDQVYRDAITGSTVFLVLIALVVFLPPRYSGPADPLDLSYIPKPEWNFLFLYQTLKYFHGPLEPLGTVGIPTVLVLIFVLLPFVDRNPERNPLKRPLVMIGALVLLAFLIAVSIIGYLSPGFAQPPSEKKGSSTKETGYTRFVKHQDPSLSHSMLLAFIGVSEAAVPPGTTGTSPETNKEPSSSPASEKGEPGRAAYIIGSAHHGSELFKKNCTPCHGAEGKTNVPNPGATEGKVPDLNPIDQDIFNPDAQVFAGNIDRYIQHGSVPEGTNPVIRMPAFGDTNTLTQQEISNIEAFVLALNGVERSQLVNPGIQPRVFFLIVVVLYVLVILILGGMWSKKSGRTD